MLRLITWLGVFGLGVLAGWLLHDIDAGVRPAASTTLGSDAPREQPDIAGLIRRNELEVGLDVVGPGGWHVLLAALEGTNPAQAGLWIEAFAARYGPTFDTHSALAAVWQERGDYALALDHLIEAEMAASDRGLVDAQLAALIAALAAEAGDDAAELGRILERLSYAFPEKARYLFMLGELRMKTGDAERGAAALAQVENHPEFGERARELLAGPVGRPGVSLRPSGGQFLLDARIDGRRTVTLLLDTGAAMTVIKSTVLSDLGYALGTANSRRFMTAGGEVIAPVVTLDRFDIGGWSVTGFSVGAFVLDLPEDAVGLLGTDFLSRYQFVINQETARLELGGP